jgi:hypothetical protein
MPIRRIARAALRLEGCLKGTRSRFHGGRKGQSLTELALALPILLLFLLGAINLGLALRAQTSLTQATQQAAQYLMNHPPATCTSGGTNDPCIEADAIVSTYLKNGFDGASAQVSFSLTAQGNALAHVNASYSFPVIMPIADKLNAGPLRNGFVTIGANADTIMATAPPPSLSGHYSDDDGGSIRFTWTAPTNPAGVIPHYQLVFDLGDGSGSTSLLPSNYTSTNFTIHCIDLPSQDQGFCNSSPGNPMPFRISAVQKNGLASALSTYALGGS